MNLHPLMPAFAIVPLILFLWALWEAKWVRRTDLTVTSGGAGGGQVRVLAVRHDAQSGEDDALRIVQLTDFHFRRVGWRERRVARIVRAARPDLLLLTGDYVERTEDLAEWGSWISELTKDVPALAVLGNHDHRPAIDAGALRRTLQAARIQLLTNEATSVRVKGRDLIVYGVDDPLLGFADFCRAWGRGRPVRRGAHDRQWPEGQLHPSRAAQPGGGDAREHASDRQNPPLQILLTHTSETAREAANAGIDLILAGDTHGGQVRLPFVGPIAAKLRYGRRGVRYVDGLYEIPRGSVNQYDSKSRYAHSSLLYVSRGIGTSHLPIRFACRPEVLVIRVKQSATSPPR